MSTIIESEEMITNSFEQKVDQSTNSWFIEFLWQEQVCFADEYFLRAVDLCASDKYDRDADAEIDLQISSTPGIRPPSIEERESKRYT